MKDIVKYISRYIPQEIKVGKRHYYFIMFMNHAHYDFRFCYDSMSNTSEEADFKYLVENISNDEELLEELKWLREKLKRAKLLTGDYATDEGYTEEKFKQFINPKS